MPASSDLLARVDIPRKFKGTQTPYHRSDFDHFTNLQPGSPTQVAGEFLRRLLNPSYVITIEAVSTNLDTVLRRDSHTFALEGDFPTLSTGILPWGNRAVDLVSLFNKATIHTPKFIGSHSDTALKRMLNIDPLQSHPYISTIQAEAGLTSAQTDPTILRGVHAQPFVYREGSTLKGEDPTRAIVTIRTQPAAYYLDERIKEIDQANEERLQRLLMEKAAVERELVSHQFNSEAHLSRIQRARAQIPNTPE